MKEAATIKHDEIMLTKLTTVDCVASEVKYHQICYKKYVAVVYNQKYCKKAKIETDIFQEFCDEYIRRKIIEGRKIKYVKDLITTYQNYCSKNGFVCGEINSKSFKEKLKAKFPHLKFIHSSRKNKSDIVLYEDNIDGIINDHVQLKLDTSNISYDTEESQYSDETDEKTRNCETINELQILYEAALIIKKHLKDHAAMNIPWPPLSSDISNENVKNSVPVVLFNFLAWISDCSTEPSLESFIEVESDKNIKLLSFCQDIMFLLSNGRNFAPKHIAISMAVRQLTRSTKLTSMLNKFGHCMSHHYTLSHETALAERNLSSIIPNGFQHNTSTILAWDNDDFCEETVTGKIIIKISFVF